MKSSVPDAQVQLCTCPLCHRGSLALPISSDTLNLVFQVLASDCIQQDLAKQASGVIEAVLQGRNSVVLAMGQPAFGKPSTLFGEGLDDPDAEGSSLGTLSAVHTCRT